MSGQRSGADRWVRVFTVAAVLAVAAVAAWVSYRHAVAVVSTHGETGWVGSAYPVTIDGLIVAASMVLLDAARHRDRTPRLAVWLLGLGIAATLAVNVLAGVGFGLLGAIVSAWPALAFVGCYELLMLLVRASARRSAKTATTRSEVRSESSQRPRARAATGRSGVRSQTDIEAAALAALAGQPDMSGAELGRRIGVSERTARRVRARLAAPAATGGESR